MELFSKDYKDLQRYYSKTYVKLPQFGEQVFQVSEVKPSHVMLTDRAGDLYKILLAEEDEPAFSFEYVLPHKAVFFWKNTVYLLARRPARQYYRGCCSENTTIHEAFTGRQVSLSFESLEAFTMKPQYFTLKQALEETSKKIVGMPLTKRLSFNRQDQCIYVDATGIAVFDLASKQFVMFDGKHIFSAEVKKLLTDSGLTYGVVDASRRPV